MITALPRIAIAMAGDDFDDAVELFRSGFGMPVLDFSERTVPDLGAHVGMCRPPGGSNIELMAPANPELPLSQALQRFLDRRGEGFYALMLEAPDPDAEADELEARGVKVLPLMAGAGGRDVHPTSTDGVLIRVYPDGSVPDDESLVAAAPGLSGIVRAMVATPDASLAAERYSQGLGLAADPAVVDDERGVLVARCHPPKGGTIELVSPVDPGRPFAGRIAAHLDERGHGLYAIVLRAPDPAAALDVLSARGVEVSDGEISAFGARIQLDQ